jgi:hypothetical protein
MDGGFQDGTGHVAFSPSGNRVYMSVSADEGSKGAVHAYHAQTGAYLEPLLPPSEFPDAVPEAFSPGVLLVLPDRDLLLVSDAGASPQTLLLAQATSPESTATLWTAPEGCAILDASVRPATLSTERLDALVLTSCKDDSSSDSSVNHVDFVPDLLSPDPRAPSPPLALLTTQLPRSVEFTGHSSFYVLVASAWVAWGSSSSGLETYPHIMSYTFDADADSQAWTESSPHLLLKLVDLKGSRDGMEPQMMRRAPNGLIYITEARYGLPLIMDPTTSMVVGQTGQFFGDLADSYALAFSPGAYGKSSKVHFSGDGAEGALPDVLVAGEEVKFEVLAADSEGSPVIAKTDFSVKILTPTGLSTSTTTLPDAIQPREDPGSYEGSFTPTKSSISLTDNTYVGGGGSGIGLACY